jgi:hypothetical protein
MKKTILLILVLGLAGLAQAGTIAVGPGAAYDFGTIQTGIDAANDGDTVVVAPGEYIVTKPISFRGKAITVRSEAGHDETIIRMGAAFNSNRGSVVIFEDNETVESVLDGFTISGGTGSRLVDPSKSVDSLAGGGIYFNASSGTVRNCAILQNKVENGGGGVFCAYQCSPILIDCVVAENSADEFGGGLLCWDNAAVSLTNCTIKSNSVTGTTIHISGYGGGISCLESSSLTLTDCNISENWAGSGGGGIQCYKSLVTITNCAISENTGGVIGGAIFCEQNASATLADCIISGNSARTWGGGIECYLNAYLTMTRCEVTSNRSQSQGGGVECSDHSSVTLTNCLIARNSAEAWGGGLSCDTAAAFMTVNNCTICGNTAGQTGGAVSCGKTASATVINSILWGNTASTGSEISLVNGSTFGIIYSNVAGGRTGINVGGGSTLNWGDGNIDVDPLFVRLGYLDDKGTRLPSDDVWVEDDLHLKSQAGRWDPDSQTWVRDDVTSPCIDAGHPMSPIGWESFPNGGFVNMGAYGGTAEASKIYFGEPICETIFAGDINGDGKVNRADLEIMALHWTGDEPLPLQ